MTNYPTITIAPLSIPGAMSQAAWRCIQQADALFLQTDQSPCARPVLDTGLAYRSMDDLYASAQDFDQLNQAIARRLCEAGDGAVYAVCGGGMGDGALQALLAAAQAEGLSVRQLPGAGFGASALCALPQALPVSGMNLCTAYDLPASLDPYHTLCIEDVDTPLTAGDVKLALGEYYPDEYLLWFCVLGEDGLPLPPTAPGWSWTAAGLCSRGLRHPAPGPAQPTDPQKRGRPDGGNDPPPGPRRLPLGCGTDPSLPPGLPH